jgi:hypothetical protein
MTYWTLVPAEEERDAKPSKVFKQFNKPGTHTARANSYKWIHGFKSKKEAIEHLNGMGVANSLRPKGFKSYDK